jgi:hypothetical protein
MSKRRINALAYKIVREEYLGVCSLCVELALAPARA